MKNKKLYALTASALLGAVGFVLMAIEISLPIMPSFIKLDFSELPALIAAFAYGPTYAIAVCFVKNFLHLFITNTAAVGELANFLMGVFFVVPAGLIYKKIKSRKGALLGSLMGSVVMGIACVFINLFITYPIYYQILIPEQVILSMYQAILPSVDSIFKSLLIFNLPFTVAKGILVSIICFVIYKKISPILKSKIS
ncbi:MAG: ECF transporter S component [Oscillospiraceae bacterium]|nr:ECF transporter S component [Oscillospiraceae bacterium]